MLNPAVSDIDQLLTETLQIIKVEEVTRYYWEQGEFLALEHLIPTQIVQEFMREVERVRPQINRNFIPGHKKGEVSVFIFCSNRLRPSLRSITTRDGSTF